MTISEKKMQIVIDNYFKSECDVNTSIRQAFEKGFRIGVKKGQSAEPERKKGKWIWQIENRYVCSECGHHTQVDELFEEPMYAFCPYCSTSMLDEEGNVRYER